ncbi:MAG: PP2C family protein-serine/threonine phosphatase [Anaerolineales bacterium]|nr:PP2C family protein-serine/threonine phosphatase [Anaerolineales bacterium]
METSFLYRIARRLRPELENASPLRRVVGTANVLGVLYGAPLALVTIFWLISQTDLALLVWAWPYFLLVAGLYIIFERLAFFIIFEITSGNYANSQSTLSGMVLWSAILLYGPTILWLQVASDLIELGMQWRKVTTQSGRWSLMRSFLLNIGAQVLAPLVALRVYGLYDGEIPIEGLMFENILPAFVAILLHFVLAFLIFSGYLIYLIGGQRRITPSVSSKPLAFFLALGLGLPFVAYPFSILAAGVYAQNNLVGYLFFISGILMVALLARQFSRAAESSRQQSRQLEQLEQLGRAIINGPPDASGLPDILQTYVPPMFPSGRILIWMEPGSGLPPFLLHHPIEWTPTVDQFWGWIRTQIEPRALLADVKIPWREDATTHSPLVVAPIIDVEKGEPVGGIYIELQTLVQPWDMPSLQRLFPAVNALAAQIASAINQADIYEEALSLQRSAQELRLAGEIQASFFPDTFPVAEGWEFSVTVLPARETSGDFFDFIPLENGKVGILIADVTDKGVGPALFMALSRTLIRTYAIEYEFDPDIVFFATNGRVLKDSRARLFVTAFFGILDQETGLLTYSNAGHNPPYLLRKNGDEPQPLSVTGMPIGIDEDTLWGKATVQIEPGDVLVLYTDGIPDAQNEDGEFFQEERLLDVARANADCSSAHELQTIIIESVQAFIGEAAQFDDITLVVLGRDVNGTGEKVEVDDEESEFA